MNRNESSDAYGRELWDYFEDGTGIEIIEREDGFIDPSAVAPRLYFSLFKSWPEIERRAIRYAWGRVLDVGCGAGRVALYLQNSKGLDVLGIDNSPLAIRVSKLRGLRKAKQIAFQEIKFNANSFDTVVMFGNNFGLFGNQKRAKLLLKRLFEITSKDAVLICESLNPYNTKDPVHLAYQKRNRQRGKMSGQLRIRVRYRAHVGNWFEYLLVSPEEMKQIVRGTGWKINRIIQSKNNPLYVAVIRK